MLHGIRDHLAYDLVRYHFNLLQTAMLIFPLKTFGEREDVAKARAEAGVDVASTTVISPIGEHYMPEKKENKAPKKIWNVGDESSDSIGG